MRKAIAVAALSFAFVFPHISAAQQVNLGTLLEDMIDRSQIAEFPNPEFLCKQCSSYNREAVSPDEPGWFSNADSSFFYGHEEIDGRREWIMMDVDGPGAVVRWWLTQQKFDGTIRIYLDDSDEPIYSETADKIVGGDAIVGQPLSNVVGWNGRNLYLPIPFQKHCRITYDGPNLQETGEFPDCIYYNINYIQYFDGTEVKTFTREDLDEYSAMIDHVQHELITPEKSQLPIIRKASGRVERLHPGNSLTCELEGVGAISSLKVRIEADDMNQALRSTVISISFDDFFETDATINDSAGIKGRTIVNGGVGINKERVLAPLGGFFGCGPGLNPFKGWWRQVHSDGWMECWWPMPFRKNAVVKIINYGDSDVSVELGDIEITDWQWTDRTMYFNSSWRSENRIETTNAVDWNYLTVDGQGVYVGDTLALFNRAVLPHPQGTGTWWGEGDEKIFVDREPFPSCFGTGTEDYYGYAWGVGGTFEAPFHSMPRGDANGNYTPPGHTTNTRVRSLDRIPFQNHLQFDMELLHWQTIANVDYAATTYWYAMESAVGNGGLTPEKARVMLDADASCN